MPGIYVHIPFCRRRCPYCDFLSWPIPGEVPVPFLDALCREIAVYEGPEEASSLFFGGGTPSLLESAALARIITIIRHRFRLVNAEITIEANPDDVTADLVSAWCDLGVNRVSLGVQSFDDSTLHYLDRRHDAAGAHRACRLVAARYDNWAMDLIFGVPPVASWKQMLATCIDYAPTHVSTYGLTYEAATPFAALAHEAVDDDTWLRLYREAAAQLTGFDRYEISNFARPGYKCRHNLLYWQNLEYVGFGPGAYSFLNGVRSRNVTDLDTYLVHSNQKSKALCLTNHEIRVETVIQHLRLQDGISKRVYYGRFGRSLEDDFRGALDRLITNGLLVEDKDSIRPTTKGFELNNEIGLALVG